MAKTKTGTTNLGYNMDEKNNSNNNSKKKPQRAYDNPDFLNSPDAREIRILSEYIEPLHRLKQARIKDTIVFYGSARTLSLQKAKENCANIENGNGFEKPTKATVAKAQHDLKMAKYYDDARQLAYKLTKWSTDLEEERRFIVCSGGGPGIMEAANRGATEAGGPTIGMNISIPFEQDPNPYISENLSFEFHYFFMRKYWFVYPAKALVVFPGGFGTFDELFELLTLRQTQKVTKPLCVVIYGKKFWESVVNFEKMVEWGVISQDDLKLFHIVDSVDEAFGVLTKHLAAEFSGQTQYWHW
jgi:uncharacterized protein (TIGR00730 family)